MLSREESLWCGHFHGPSGAKPNLKGARPFGLPGAGRHFGRDHTDALKHMVIDVALDFDAKQVTGTVTHTIEAIGNGLREVALDAGGLDEDEIARLHEATRETLRWWIDHLIDEVGDGFPEKVTAFRPEMAVHGKFGQSCPDCGAPVQRIVHADNETNYCAPCQTGGKILADRVLSQLMKNDWPRTLEDWEERIG